MPEYISMLPDVAWQKTTPRSLVILGSTGSIGTSTLDVVRLSKGTLLPLGLAGGNNIALLAQQASEFRPLFLAMSREEDVDSLLALLPSGYKPTILTGQEGFETIAQLEDASLIVSAQSGAAGLRGTVAAVEAGKMVALANKESLVLAGNLIRETCKKTGAVILPVDSEHNALLQCLAGNNVKAIKKLILTASGGPFWGKDSESLSQVTAKDALNHPNWSMGPKITVDSATLMNKGLEVIEAYHLFGLPLEQIEVLIHRQSIVHSLVEYKDGSTLAQMGVPDMRVAISYCLHWPNRVETHLEQLSLASIGTLSFEACENLPSPCLSLAKEALVFGNGCEIVLNAANEVAVAAFLDGRIGFSDIARIVAKTCEKYKQASSFGTFDTVSSILIQDSLSRWEAEEIISKGNFQTSLLS